MARWWRGGWAKGVVWEEGGAEIDEDGGEERWWKQVLCERSVEESVAGQR